MYKILQGGLVRKGELKESEKSKYLYFTVAENFSKRTEKGEWEEVGTLYHECSVSGYLAECFNKLDVPLGTRLVISGRTGFSPERTYTNKEGVEVTVPATDTIYVDNLGVGVNNAKFFELDGSKKEKSVEPEKETSESSDIESKVDSDLDLGFDDSDTKPSSETSSDEEDIFGDWDF